MLRLLVTPRWIGWTLCALVVVAVCGAMAYWQLLRAESPTGSLLNAGYALQWPLFGIFFGYLWWRMLRAEARALITVRAARERPELTPVRAAPAGSPFGPRPAGTRDGGFDAEAVPGSARARYNVMLAQLHEVHEEVDR